MGQPLNNDDIEMISQSIVKIIFNYKKIVIYITISGTCYYILNQMIY